MQNDAPKLLWTARIQHLCVLLSILLALVIPRFGAAAASMPSANPESTLAAHVTTATSAPAEDEVGSSADSLLGLNSQTEGTSISDSLTTMVRVLLALTAILILAYLLLHRGLGALSGKLSKGRIIRVVDRVGLEPKKSLYVIEVAGSYFLVGTTDHGVSCLSTLSSPENPGVYRSTLKRDVQAASPPRQTEKVEPSGGQDA